MSSLPQFSILYGEEFLRQEKLESLRKIASEEGRQKSQFFFETSREPEEKWKEVLAGTQSLFSEANDWIEIHLLTGKAGQSGAKFLQKLAQEPPPDAAYAVILCTLDWRGIKDLKNNKWYKAFEAVGAQIFEFKDLFSNQFAPWVRNRLQSVQLDIEPEALQLLVERTDKSLLAAHQEIQRLSLTYPAYHRLTVEEIRQSTNQSMQFDIWDFLRAWLSGDVEHALRMLANLQMQDENAIIGWVIMMSKNIRTLIRVKAALAQKQSSRTIIQQLDLKTTMRDYAFDAANRLTTAQLIKSLQLCALTDMRAKGLDQNDSPWQSAREIVKILAG